MEDEARWQKLAIVAKWKIGLAGAIIISPFIFLAVRGIVRLALAVVIGMTVIQFYLPKLIYWVYFTYD